MACFNVQIWKILLINYLHMKVGILAYTHCTSSMVTGVADVLAFANLQQANTKTVTRKKVASSFEVDIISENGDR